MDEHSKAREERILQRSEKRRKRALDALPLQCLRSVLEESPTPIIVYENDHITYANPAAIAKLGYSFEQLMTFNDITLDTGARKERLDNILGPCARQGWDELDLELSITTLDRQELRLRPHLRHERVNGVDFWIAYILDVEKVDPNKLVRRAINAFSRVFQREQVYLKAPAYIERDFIVNAIRRAATESSANLVIDLKRTQGIDKGVLPILEEFSKGSSFKDHLFLINASEPLYHVLKYYRIPSEIIYCARPRYAPAPA